MRCQCDETGTHGLFYDTKVILNSFQHYISVVVGICYSSVFKFTVTILMVGVRDDVHVWAGMHTEVRE